MARTHKTNLINKILRFDSFRIDCDDRMLWRAGQPIVLAPKEFDTLLALAESGGKLLEKQAIIARVWPDSFVGDGSLARNISVLRKHLGEDLIQTVPKVGYRLASAVTVETAEDPIMPAFINHDIPVKDFHAGVSVGTPAVELPLTPTNPAWRLGRRSLIFLLLVVVVAGTAGWLVLRPGVRPATASPRLSSATRIAVLPFGSSDSGEDDYLAEGIMDAMISEFSRLGPQSPSVIARTSVIGYHNTARQRSLIAAELGADFLLDGELRRSGDNLHIKVRLLRASDGVSVWQAEYQRSLAGLIQVEHEMAAGVARSLQPQLALANHSPARAEHKLSAENYRDFLLGRYYLNQRSRAGVLRAKDYFQRALDSAPEYAEAWAGLSDTYIQEAIWGIAPFRVGYQKGEWAARKALAINPDLAEAYAALGLADYMYEWQWKDAEKNFQRAIALDPNFASAHARYAYYLAAFRRSEEAGAEIRRALELDPLSVAISQNAGFIYAQGALYPEAVRQLEQALELDPANQVTHGYLALAYEWQGNYEKALQEFAIAQKASGRYVPYAAGVGHVQAMMGRTREARQTMRRLLAMRQREPVSSYAFASICAALGERDEAFRWLNESMRERSLTITELNNDHALDSLRADQRFAELRRQFRLEQN